MRDETVARLRDLAKIHNFILKNKEELEQEMMGAYDDELVLLAQAHCPGTARIEFVFSTSEDDGSEFINEGGIEARFLDEKNNIIGEAPDEYVEVAEPILLEMQDIIYDYVRSGQYVAAKTP